MSEAKDLTKRIVGVCVEIENAKVGFVMACQTGWTDRASHLETHLESLWVELNNLTLDLNRLWLREMRAACDIARRDSDEGDK